MRHIGYGIFSVKVLICFSIHNKLAIINIIHILESFTFRFLFSIYNEGGLNETQNNIV